MATAAPTKPQTQLETFANPQPDRDYTIRIGIPEFTCLCPKTGQPDFAQLELEYVPAGRCVELKSLKLYIWSFRNRGAFHEAVTNEVLATLVAATEPRFMRLAACTRRSSPSTASRAGSRRSRSRCREAAGARRRRCSGDVRRL
jgi:7-cyano-7-deazaguanine reductase